MGGTGALGGAQCRSGRNSCRSREERETLSESRRGSYDDNHTGRCDLRFKQHAHHKRGKGHPGEDLGRSLRLSGLPGHGRRPYTDDVQIAERFTGRYASNWELSSARAHAVVHYLTKNQGADPERLSAIGYGEYQPVADNTTPEGRAENRRVVIAVRAKR